MVAMAPGKTIRSKDPTLVVDGDLPAGSYRFRLVVVDDESNASLPSDLIVQVTAPPSTGPTIRPSVRTPTVTIPTEVLRRRPLGGTR